MKLHLGCGFDYKKGYLNIDCVERKKSKYDFLKHDLNKPLPIKDNTVTHTFSNHFFEHIQNLDELMTEIYRVSKDNAKLEIIVPHFTSLGNYYEFHVRSCRYDFLWDYYLNPDDKLVKSKYELIKRKLVFKGVYSFMNIINLHDKLIGIYEGTFLRNVFFAHEIELVLKVKKHKN